MFHKKTRLADTITPEALILSLHYGSGNLVIKSDEFKVLPISAQFEIYILMCRVFSKSVWRRLITSQLSAVLFLERRSSTPLLKEVRLLIVVYLTNLLITRRDICV